MTIGTNMPIIPVGMPIYPLVSQRTGLPRVYSKLTARLQHSKMQQQQREEI